MSRLQQLQQQIADDGARENIESFCFLALVEDGHRWYSECPDDPENEIVAPSVEYLTLRGLIARHPEHGWVMVNIAQPIVFPSAQGVAAVIDMGQVIQPDGYAVDPKSEDLPNFERMFMAACSDLGAINEALGLDPDDGGAEPILEAIEALKQSLAQPAQEPKKPTEISLRLREYASNPGYSHNDYADTMRAAAEEIERYYGGMVAWKATAEAKDAQQPPQEVSIDVSTCDVDAGNRIFGKIIGEQDGVILAEETSRNFAQQPVQEPECKHVFEQTGDVICRRCGKYVAQPAPAQSVVPEGQCAADGVWHCQRPKCDCKKPTEAQRDERALFEKWSESKNAVRFGAGYLSEPLSFAWKAWQAAIQSAKGEL